MTELLSESASEILRLRMLLVESTIVGERQQIQLQEGFRIMEFMKAEIDRLTAENQALKIGNLIDV